MRPRAPGDLQVLVVVVPSPAELDVLTAPAFEAALAEALRGARRVVADLSGLRFCDSAGLQALVRSTDLAGRSGRQLVVRGAGRPLLRLVELLDVAAGLELEPA